MHIHILILDDVAVEIEYRCVGLQILKGDCSRLLHHISEVAGQGQAALAIGTGCLNIKHVSADRGPGQSDRHAGLALPVFLLIGMQRHAEDLLQVLGGELFPVLLSAGNQICLMTHHLGYLLFQHTHARFAGIL